jgi:hypothetical protein
MHSPSYSQIDNSDHEISYIKPACDSLLLSERKKKAITLSRALKFCRSVSKNKTNKQKL